MCNVYGVDKFNVDPSEQYSIACSPHTRPLLECCDIYYVPLCINYASRSRGWREIEQREHHAVAWIPHPPV